MLQLLLEFERGYSDENERLFRLNSNTHSDLSRTLCGGLSELDYEWLSRVLINVDRACCGVSQRKCRWID